MPSGAHEIVVSAVREHPEWLDALLRATGHAPLPPHMILADTVLRLVDPVEVRPDVLFVAKDAGTWAMVEVQMQHDEQRGRRWLVAAAVLLNERRTMGDVIVIAHRRHVARWSEAMVEFVGPAGTRLALAPIVVQLTGDDGEALLATGQPELAPRRWQLRPVPPGMPDYRVTLSYSTDGSTLTRLRTCPSGGTSGGYSYSADATHLSFLIPSAIDILLTYTLH